MNKTCICGGKIALDIIKKRNYPEGFEVGRKNKFVDELVVECVGNTCGNVATMLPYLGVQTFPIGHFDCSEEGLKITSDFKRYGIKKVHTSMEECLQELKSWMERPKQEHHLEAPRFDSAEALAEHPEFVDMLAMNQSIMEQWNKTVAPGDKVMVNGEMPDSEWLQFLNGEIVNE